MIHRTKDQEKPYCELLPFRLCQQECHAKNHVVLKRETYSPNQRLEILTPDKPDYSLIFETRLSQLAQFERVMAAQRGACCRQCQGFQRMK